MSELVQYLAEYVRSGTCDMLNGRSSQQVRMVFQGPPPKLLDQVMQQLLTGGSLPLDTQTGRIDAPVFVVDAAARNPEGLDSGHCTADHLVTVRNSPACQCFVCLVPSGVSLNESIRTSSTFLGDEPEELHAASSWYERPFAATLVRAGVKRLGLGGKDEPLLAVINRALRDAAELDVSLTERPHQWDVLERLFAAAKDERKMEKLLAGLGFPPCEPDEVGSGDHVNVMEKVAAQVEADGFTAKREEWSGSAPEDVCRAIDEACDHIRQRCDNPSNFAKAPSWAYQAVLPGSGEEPPSWWKTLTLQTWSELLEDHEPKPKDGLVVACEGCVVEAGAGLPSVFQTKATFRLVASETAVNLPVEVVVSRSAKGRKFEELTRITMGDREMNWSDEAPPAHDRAIRYRFETPQCRTLTVPAVILDCYDPGVVVCSYNAGKHSLFKKKTEKDSTSGKKVTRYECDLELPGVGNHHLDIYHGKQVKLGDKIIGYETTSEHGGEEPRPINKSGDMQGACLIETDEESSHEFAGTTKDGHPDIFRIFVRAGDTQPVGASSEFDRLIMEHRRSMRDGQRPARVEPVSCRSADLEQWMLEDEGSFYPLIIGDDYLAAWRRPNWAESPVLSMAQVSLDPRPGLHEFAASGQLIARRKAVQKAIRGSGDSDDTLLESIPLGERLQDDEFRSLVIEYIDQYRQWLAADYDTAAWFDVIIVTQRDATGGTLETYPRAILLSPLHPVRLAWQCAAQGLLKDAIDRHAQCPAASVLAPETTPDCLALPCRTATGQRELKVFLAVASSSDYWSVLWNSQHLEDLGQGSSPEIFDAQFGITVDGLATGFSVAQVERAIEEVSAISNAKSSLRVALSSDTRGASACNEGIASWCANSLGEQDPWSKAGPMSLQIHDTRDPELMPEDAALAAVTQETNGDLKWFRSQGKDVECDLAIVAHLGTSNPELARLGLRAAVDACSLTRTRIRKQLITAGGRFLAESRVGRYDPADATLDDLPGFVGPLAAVLGQTVMLLEDKCSEQSDSYVFAPRTPTLQKALEHSRYCAVSSTNVDPSCFFNIGDTSFLWDYDLPSYSRRAGENSGFYLLATESPTMIEATRGAMSCLGPAGSSADDAMVRRLLLEISRRGVPTLKRLTQGGAASVGEVGVLVALRILQSDFADGLSWPSVFPAVEAESRFINLVVPVDPFRAYFDDLRGAMHMEKFDRPDLLAISISIEQQAPVAMRITPIEIKARTAVMNASQLEEALGQAQGFSDFLRALALKQKDHAIWGIAFRHLLGSWLDYAFRVYGQLTGAMSLPEWTRWHESVVLSIASGRLSPEVDPCGRLIVIDATASSKPRDVDHDEFSETIVLNHRDALEILTMPDASVMGTIVNCLAGWRLRPTGRAEAPNTSPEPKTQEPGGSGAGTTPVEPREELQPVAVDVPLEPAALAPSIGLRFAVGTTADAFEPRECCFYPGNTDLNQLNVGIVGDLGTGKTQLIQALLYQMVRRPDQNRGQAPRVLIFDYKKDYSKPDFVRAMGARVVRPEAIPLNLFDTRDSSTSIKPWLQRAKCFIDILTRIYPGVGPVQQDQLKQAVRRSYEDSIAMGRPAPTIYDVNDAYRELIGDADAPAGIMGDMVDMELFAKDAAGMMSFKEFLQGVVVLDLGELGADDRTKSMLVAVFLNLYYEYMLKVEKKPFIGTSPQLRAVDSFLLVDEADNIMQYDFDVLRKILLQGREFGTGVVLASQYLSHFKTKANDYREPLLTWLIHRVPNLSVRDLEGIGLTSVDHGMVERIKALPKHHCLYKTFDVGGEVIRATPFYQLVATPT